LSWACDHFIHYMSKYFLSAHILFGIFRGNDETILSASRSPDFDSEVKAYFTEWLQMLKPLLSTRKTVLAHIGGTLSRLGLNGRLRIFSPAPEALDNPYFDAWVIMLFRACCWGACHGFCARRTSTFRMVGKSTAYLYRITSTLSNGLWTIPHAYFLGVRRSSLNIELSAAKGWTCY
jgi:hypothetical protein